MDRDNSAEERSSIHNSPNHCRPESVKGLAPELRIGAAKTGRSKLSDTKGVKVTIKGLGVSAGALLARGQHGHNLGERSL